MERARAARLLTLLVSLGYFGTAALHSTGYPSIARLAAQGPDPMDRLMPALWLAFSSDLFSAGVVLYQMLTGEKPFAGNRVATIIHKILELDPPDPSKLTMDVPEAFDDVMRTAIAKSPDDRYQTGAEFAEAIRVAAEAE